MKKNTLPSFFLRAFAAFAFLAMVTATTQAAQVKLDPVDADDCYLLDLGTDTYETGDMMFLYIKTSEAIDPTTVSSNICLRFSFSDKKTTHLAPFAFCDEDPETGERLMVFSYTVEDEDFSQTGVYPGGPTLFAGGSAAEYAAIKTEGGDSILGFQTTQWRNRNVAIDEVVLVNPNRDAFISVYFLDEEGNPIEANSFPTFVWGQRNIRYVLDVGHAPSAPAAVEIDWGATNVFFEEQVTTVTVTDAVTTNTIPCILDNGAAFNIETPYTITATKIDEGGTERSATMTAKVRNTFEIAFCNKEDFSEVPEVNEGDNGLNGKGYVVFVNRGADPPGGVQTVTIDWAVANVFAENTTTNFQLTGATGASSAIGPILDNGPAANSSHTHTITATIDDSGRKAQTTVTVKNVDPEFRFLGSPDALFGTTTNQEFVAGAIVTNTVYFYDPAGALDQTFTVRWTYGNTVIEDTNPVQNGPFWMSQSSGELREGVTVVSVRITDKNSGSTVTTNLAFTVPPTPPGPVLLADPAKKNYHGLAGIGDGTITIVTPKDKYGHEIEWVPEVGTELPYDQYGNHGRINANPLAVNDYDSFYYKWYDEAVDNDNVENTLISGDVPIVQQATVQLWTKKAAATTVNGVSSNYDPTHPVLTYLFSREKFRPDNFGDIDGDSLADIWEIDYFGLSVPIDGEENPVIPSESAIVRRDGTVKIFDFSGSGNIDGDGLPAECLQTIRYAVPEDVRLDRYDYDEGRWVKDDQSHVLAAGEYDLKTFLYPLDPKTVRTYGYLPLGSTEMAAEEGGDEESVKDDIAAFRANPYVDETAKANIERRIVNFSNEIEFRGIGKYLGYDDGFGGTIAEYAPVGDGDDPNTDPTLFDTDGDGMPDGWEYYFWAVAYYEIGSDQWVAFDGTLNNGYTYQGTGAPIAREDILTAFNPASAAAGNNDIDNDGLTNSEEYLLGTNPIHWDTDGDGMPDGWEVDYGSLDDTATVTTTDEEGNTVITIDDTSKIFLNPLDPKDATQNPDGDWFAASGDRLHFDVFEDNDFDPRTGWHDPAADTVSYAGNTFRVSYPNTAKYTALDEFNLAAWYRSQDETIVPSPDNWDKLTTRPGSADTDEDGMPDGWECYVGLDPNAPGDATGDEDGDLLNNFHEFLCTMAIDQYEHLADSADEAAQWPNKPWPTNPRASLGLGFADGADTDGDQILDSFEQSPNANPTCVDTDHDWLPDAWECYYGTDPLFRDAHVDYDGDGLANWQEYLAGAVWAWQYDKWYDLARIEGGFGPKGPGYGEVDMFDFFVSAGDRDAFARGANGVYGGFGRHPHPWDVSFGARSRIAGAAETTYLYYFLLGEPRSGLFSPQLVSAEGLSNTGISNLGEDLTQTGFNDIIVDGTVGSAEHAVESRWTYSQSGPTKIASCDPWDTDTDHDGMDDYYEAFHGLNPLYGGEMLQPDYDVVGKTDPLNNGAQYPSCGTGFPWDILSYPWLVGDPAADPDKDGLSSREESANFYVNGGTHHTDPSPYWLTDPSYERSFVNLYYQPGYIFANGLGDVPPLWYFGYGTEQNTGSGAPRYAFDFEVNEGYDTDNDNVPDRSEATVDELASKADPLDFDNPRRRKVLYFNGVDAAARTRGTYSAEDVDDLRNFTVEAWICPVDPSAGHLQTLIERSAIVPQDTAFGSVTGKRLNFRLSITEVGALRGEFHNYQGAHVTMETTAENAGLRAGVWTHVAMTYSGSPAKSGYLTIYANGKSIGSRSSNLQAFNGLLQDTSAEYINGVSSNVVETTSEISYRYTTCPIVLGASDANPGGEVNGHVEYANGGTISPGTEPDLEDFFQGWMDEVRIWNGASSEEAIRARMFDRMDRAAVLDNLASPVDKIARNTVELRYHYTFDNLPDVLPAADRDTDAYLYPSDVETLPVGFPELFTAPIDGSYPGIRWWDTSVWRAYHYDSRHIPWIENTVAHLAKVPVRDVPRVTASYNDAGDVAGWAETVWQANYGSTAGETVDQLTAGSALSGANRYNGVAQPASWLPNLTDPYNTAYTTVMYGTNYLWSSGTNDAAYARGDYDRDEGSLLQNEFLDWASDLLPLGGAVADIDVEVWDGRGVGYNLATVDTDGDGIPDWWETLYGLDPFDASDAWGDDDRDGLDNLAEYLAGTHPAIADTDGDGYSDYFSRDTDKSLTYGETYDDGDNMPSWWEALYDLNPRVDDGAEDPDGDGWSNYAEYLAGTDPCQSSRFPVPPVVANVTYDGNQASGTLVLYGWHDSAMFGRPDAVYTMQLQPKDTNGQQIQGTSEYNPGTMLVTKEYLATLHDGQRTYSGQLAFGNVVDDSTLVFEVYESESVHREENDVKPEVSSTFYCRHCGLYYSQSQMTELSGGTYRCPKGHGPICSVHTDDEFCYYQLQGRGTALSSGAGAYGSIDYDTGKWTITFPDVDDAGWVVVATYNTVPESTFPASLRRKWTSPLPPSNPSVVQGGHLREGENRFFAFLDLDGDFLYDQNEPAGMALYQPMNVGVGTVELTIPLTDTLTGYPRFGWDAAGVDEYFVSLSLGSTALVTKQSVGSRTFFMENDVASINGVNLAASKMPTITWSVFTNVNDTVPYAEGSTAFDVYSTTRKTLSILAPAEGSVVSDASLLLKWNMDWRNEGVSITLTNTDTGNTPLNGVVNFPQRVGSLNGDYHYELEPQKTLCRSTLADLPDGHYTVSIGEFVQNTGVTKQSKTVRFLIDRTGSIDPNAQTDHLGTISGTIRYYGKVPFSVENEIVGTFDGVSTRLIGALTRSPIPGAVSVYVVQGATTNFVASDTGAQIGYTIHGLSSSYGSMIQTGSYVVYGDSPAVSLELETPPVAGSQLVVSYKHYGCPIRIQAFSTKMDDGASFSVAPTAQITVYNKGAFTLAGLPAGTYYLRAFLDQNYNSFCDSWESVGYAMNIVRDDIGINNFAGYTIPPRVSNVDIVLYDRDTDADQLPDAWEYFYFGGIANQGGYTSKKAGVLLWQEYADGELDSNPLVEDTDGDGLPDVIEHQIGSNNHAWDSDGDGIGDLEEFLAGSDPTDATSKRHFAAPTPTFLEDGTPALLFETPYLAPGTYLKYELLAKDNLSDPKWTTAGFSKLIGVYKDEPVGVAPGLVAVPDPDAAAASGFYKVKAHFESDTLLDK